MHSGSGGKIWQLGRKCIFSSGSLPTLQLCSERNRRLHEEMCADITVQYIIAIPCRPLKTTLDCLSLINVVPARKKSKSIRACKKKQKKTNLLLSQPCYEGLPFKTLKLAQNADVTRCHQLVITSPCLWLPLAVLVADLKLLISLHPRWGAPCPIQTSFSSIFSLVLKKEGTHCGERGVGGRRWRG